MPLNMTKVPWLMSWPPKNKQINTKHNDAYDDDDETPNIPLDEKHRQEQVRVNIMNF